MTLADIKKLPTLQTRTIAEACKDPQTLLYVSNCLTRFYAGDYGEIGQEDTDANNSDLAEGYGHILARYKRAGRLEGDFYIETHFDKDHLNNIDYSQTLIMYPSER